jgi:hypothetical protein
VGLEISNAWKRYFGGCGGGLGTAVSNRIFQLPPSNINCGPKSRSLNRCAGLVFSSDTVFTHGHRRIGSQRPSLIDRHVVMIKSRLECAFVELCNVSLWTCCIDEHASRCVERSNPSCLPVLLPYDL